MQLPQVSAYGVQVLFGFVGQHRADLKQDAGRRGSIGSFPEVGGGLGATRDLLGL